MHLRVGSTAKLGVCIREPRNLGLGSAEGYPPHPKIPSAATSQRLVSPQEEYCIGVPEEGSVLSILGQERNFLNNLSSSGKNHSYFGGVDYVDKFWH